MALYRHWPLHSMMIFNFGNSHDAVSKRANPTSPPSLWPPSAPAPSLGQRRLLHTLPFANGGYQLGPVISATLAAHPLPASRR